MFTKPQPTAEALGCLKDLKLIYERGTSITPILYVNSSFLKSTELLRRRAKIWR